jgi:hypothetical protein
VPCVCCLLCSPVTVQQSSGSLPSTVVLSSQRTETLALSLLGSRHSATSLTPTACVLPLTVLADSGMVGTVVGSALGFILFVLLSMYGYAVYRWHEHGLHGNSKPAYRYQKTVTNPGTGNGKDTPAPSVPLAVLNKDKKPGVAPVPSAPPAAAAVPRSPPSAPAPSSPRPKLALPAGWSLHKDAQDRDYYFNTKTGQSQWTRPTA